MSVRQTIGNDSPSLSKLTLWRRLKKQKWMQIFVLLGILFLLIFNYIPMIGILIAFKEYSIVDGLRGIFTSKFIGFANFNEFFTDYKFWNIVRNTLVFSSLKLLFAFPLPIAFAIMLNELPSQSFKRMTQTVSYLPHFISWIIISGIGFAFLSDRGGIVNNALIHFGFVDAPIPFLVSPEYFWGISVFLAVWKETGWWTIIFLAAISGIDPGLYEAAQIDGASRMKRIWHITLPAMKGSIIVVLVLAVGSFLGGGLGGSNFEQAYLMGNPLNNDTSEIIQTYAFKVGLAQGRFSYATAIDLIQSVISVFLLFGSNALAKKVSGTSLY